MKELIKQIRQYTGLSQTEMASKIGVRFATINRWENGHLEPTRLAQEGLYTLCENSNHESNFEKLSKTLTILTF